MSGRDVGSAKSHQAIPGLVRSGDVELTLSLRRSPSTPLRQRPGRTGLPRVSEQLSSSGFSRFPSRRAILRGMCLGMILHPMASAQQPGYECLIEPQVVIDVSTAVEGVLRTVEVKKGDLVSKGQLVATLESELEEAALQIAQARAGLKSTVASRAARLQHDRRKLERAEELHARSVISHDEREDAEVEATIAEHELAEAREQQRLAKLEVKRARALLELRRVRSPIDGVVVNRYLSPGEFAKAQPILKLAQIDPLKVEVVLPTAMYGRVDVQTGAEVFPEQPVEGTYRAVVTVAERVIDAASGTFAVELELPNPEHTLPAGIGCRIRFDGVD